MVTEAQKRAVSYGPQPDIAAASLRGCMRGEGYPITVTAATKRFLAPEAWKGALVRIEADGADIYYQISTAIDAACDKDARAEETNNAGILTLEAAPGGCFKIAAGDWLDVYFPADASTFALQGTATGVARCHLSES